MKKEVKIIPTRNNVLVINPVKPRPKSIIQVTPEMEAKADEEWAKEQLSNAEKVTVAAVGPSCIDVKEGDVVKIKANRFFQAEPLENGKLLLFTEGDIIAIYR